MEIAEPRALLATAMDGDRIVHGRKRTTFIVGAMVVAAVGAFVLGRIYPPHAPTVGTITSRIPEQAPDWGRLQLQVLDALNGVRANPIAYVDPLRSYRGFFHANLVVVPGQPANFITEEGVAPVDEAISYVQKLGGEGALEPSDMLAKAAASHVADQGASGGTGHFGEDGASPSDRMLRVGGGPRVAEVITYGTVDAADVIRQLVVDDGVPDRGHRLLMFQPDLRYAGVACGPHPEFRTMCVIDMAETPDGRDEARSFHRVRLASNDNSRANTDRR